MGADLVVKGRDAVMGKKPEDPNKGKEKQKNVGEDEPDLLNTAFNLGHKKSPMVYGEQGKLRQKTPPVSATGGVFVLLWV